MPKHSLIINTACGDAHTAGNRNPYRSARYGERASLLADHILPAVHTCGFNEVLIAGVFPQRLAAAFPEFSWVVVPPQRRNRWDGLLQREMGARFATGDTLTFCHDDHSPAESYAYALDSVNEPWDILVPRRIHATTREELNNGRADGYMGGHCYTMQRWLWAALPLTTAPDEWWDIWLTPRWLQLGAKMVYSDTITHYDLEATPDEA
jgi:hypothetical protein